MTIESVYKEYAIKVHENVNQKYYDYIPYQFHLELVVKNINKFSYLIPEISELDELGIDVLRAGGWGHDIIEDTGKTYNDVSNAWSGSKYGQLVADIVYACTNEKGKNRAERANDKYYQGIIQTPGARYIKICDRIANVEFGIFMNNMRMASMYKKEALHFSSILYDSQYKDMFNYLDILYSQIK